MSDDNKLVLLVTGFVALLLIVALGTHGLIEGWKYFFVGARE